MQSRNLFTPAQLISTLVLIALVWWLMDALNVHPVKWMFGVADSVRESVGDSEGLVEAPPGVEGMHYLDEPVDIETARSQKKDLGTREKMRRAVDRIRTRRPEIIDACADVLETYGMRHSASLLSGPDRDRFLERVVDGEGLSVAEWVQVGSDLRAAAPLVSDLVRATRQPGFSPALLRHVRQETGTQQGQQWGDAELLAESVRTLCLEAVDLSHRLENGVQGASSDVDSARVVDLLQSAGRLCAPDPSGDPGILAVQSESLDLTMRTWQHVLSTNGDKKLIETSIASSQQVAEHLEGLDERRLAQMRERIEGAKTEEIDDLVDRLGSVNPSARARSREYLRQMQAIGATAEKMLEEDHTQPTVVEADVIRVRFGLFQLHLADSLNQKLDDTETTIDEGVPPFARMLKDPWSKSPFSYNEERAAWYAYGPDAKDDGGRVPYDPTNGTLSEGDILLNLRSVGE